MRFGMVTARSVTARRAARRLVLLLALVVAACGGTASVDSTYPSVVDAAASGETVDEAPDEEPTESTGTEPDEDEPETLGDYLGYDFDDPEAAAARAMEDQRRVEESIARCMAQEGFEYIPAVRPVSSSRFAFDQEEFAREQGFGITTWYGREDSFLSQEQDDWEDPNRAIVDSLSESERDAYDEVLHGTFDESAFGEVDPETGEPAFPDDPFGGGCQGQAYEEVYGAQEEMWEKLGPELEEMWQRVQADPRFKEADREWVECMADKGYSYDGIDSLYEDVYEDFQRRLDEITGGADPFTDPFEGWTEEEIDAFFEERSEEEIEDFFAQVGRQETDEVDQDALAALQQEEIDLAVAAFECQEALMDAYEELQREYEGHFIRENRDILEELGS
ncbi:MAG: hypothetical protein OXS29_09680 [bacterium]|nr:hypothetical protein [bacterium]MDE0289838.1 hypothetical protein [bacterium]MDE0438031.1 hypothetical protein [bacterium]